MTEEENKTLFFASKEINSNFTGLEVFNVITVCTLEHAAAVYKLMQSTFDSAEQVFVCKQGQALESLTGICIQYTILYSCFYCDFVVILHIKALFSDGKTTSPSVSVAIVGHWSQDGSLHEIHINGQQRALCFALLMQMLGAKL